MDAPKYIVFDGESIGMPDFPVIFPCYFTHDQIANKFPMCKPLGAGTVHFNGNALRSAGKSIGLGISSRGERDDEILKQIS